MTEFLAFCLYLTLGSFLMIAIPILQHPTLPKRRKVVILSVLFTLYCPGSLALYGILGAPPLAVL